MLTNLEYWQTFNANLNWKTCDKIKEEKRKNKIKEEEEWDNKVTFWGVADAYNKIKKTEVIPLLMNVICKILNKSKTLQFKRERIII